MKEKRHLVRQVVYIALTLILILGTQAGTIIRAEGNDSSKENPSGADDYYNARTNKDAIVMDPDIIVQIKEIKMNTPVHLTGKTQEKMGMTGVDDHGDPVEGMIKYVEVELKDGTIGWMLAERIEIKKATIELFVKSDSHLSSTPSANTKTEILVYEGEKVEVLETKDSYSRVKAKKSREGWVPSANLVKLEPKYVYCTKKTSYYYNSMLDKNYKIGNAGHGRRGILAVGTKVEYVSTPERKGFTDVIYQIITPTEELAFVDAKCFSFELPKTVYVQDKTSLYQSAKTSSKKVSSLEVGIKATRLDAQGNFYKVKTENNKTGWVEKNSVDTKKIAKVKKSYGTYYLTGVRGEDTQSYPTGTKVVQIDPYFYEFSGSKNKSKVQKEPYVFIKGQYPDGKTRGFTVMKNGDLNTSKKKAMTLEKDLTFHVKGSEQSIFKEFNAYRKSKGKKELKWDDTAYLFADSYFNYCVKRGDTSFPHSGDSYGWSAPYDDIILSGIAMGVKDTAEVSKMAMESWKESPGHNRMLLDEQYESAAVAVMYNDCAKKMEIVIMCSKVKGKVEFTPSDDNFIAKKWFPFIFKDPKFTNNRGDAYTGLNY